MGKSRETSVVKIDSDLLKRVDNFILLEENKFKFVNKKQFIDLAVSEYLKKEGEQIEKKK